MSGVIGSAGSEDPFFPMVNLCLSLSLAEGEAVELVFSSLLLCCPPSSTIAFFFASFLRAFFDLLL